MNWLKTIFDLLLSLLMPKPKQESITPASPQNPVTPKLLPKLNPLQYRDMLQAEATRTGVMPDDYTPEHPYSKPYGYDNVADDPKTAKNERRTYCNMFTRTVCRWFGWTTFNTSDKDQAGEIHDYMFAHPEHWKKVSFDEAIQLALQGHLIIAAQKEQTPPPTGHVAVVAPEQGMYSNKWKKVVPVVANVGGNNFYGKGLSFAFKNEPPTFLYLG